MIIIQLGGSQKPFLSRTDAVDILSPNWHYIEVQVLKVFLFLVLSLSMLSCRKENDTSTSNQKEDTHFFKTPPEELTELSSNQLSGEPSDFLRNQSTSSIHWQPWTPEVRELAEKSQRLIFVFAGSTNHPTSQSVAKLLADKFGDIINKEYVPVMADLELDPALALACYHLSRENNEPFAFPYLLWLSHEGNPVAWVPVKNSEEENILIGFRRAQGTVQAITEKSTRYVVENSRYDNDNRLKRMQTAREPNEEIKALHPTRNNLFLSAQLMADLYDSLDQTFDNTGGIPPGHLITTLARMSQHPAAPPRFKKSATEATKGAVEQLASSAIRDPLDGYFFTRRNSRSFAVPTLSKNLKTQAEMLSAMSSSPRTPASTQAIQQMLTSLSENPLRTNSLSAEETNELAFFWSIEALKNILSDEELIVAKAAFNLRGLGNVSSTDDPQRKYFRRNTLGLELFGPELAEKVGKSEPQTEQLLASAIEKIKSRRAEILEAGNSLQVESMSVLSTKSRLLTAMARTQASQPQESTLEAVNALGEEILANYQEESGHLLRTPSRENSRKSPAFANDYIVTIEALLEWYRVTWKPELLETSQKLTTILLNEFTSEDNFLVEAKVENSALTFPIFGWSMIFGPSTWGTAHGTLSRMLSLGHEHPKLAAMLEATTPIQQFTLGQTPVTFTDYIIGAINNLDGYVLVVAEGEKDNQQLRNTLAQAQFDSVCTVVENSTFKDFPSPGNNAAILLKKGERIASYATTGEISSSLRATLAK